MFKEILATYLFKKIIGKERSIKLGRSLEKYTAKTASIIFGFMAIAHSIRFAFGVEASLSDWNIPLWFSFGVAVITGYLSFSLWKMK